VATARHILGREAQPEPALARVAQADDGQVGLPASGRVTQAPAELMMGRKNQFGTRLEAHVFEG